MRKNKVNISDELVNDLKKFSGEVSKALAINSRELLFDTSKRAVEYFYNTYDPVSYKRHYYNFRENSFKKYYKNPHGSIYRGGVVLSHESMDDIYQDSTEEVFDMFWHGIHGVASGFVSPKSFSVIPPVTQPSPLEMVEMQRKDIVDNINDYKDTAIEEANKQSYTTIRRRLTTLI